MVPVKGLVSMLIKHVGKDRNKDVGEDLVRISVRKDSVRRDSGRAAVLSRALR